MPKSAMLSFHIDSLEKKIMSDIPIFTLNKQENFQIF